MIPYEFDKKMRSKASLFDPKKKEKSQLPLSFKTKWVPNKKIYN